MQDGCLTLFRGGSEVPKQRFAYRDFRGRLELACFSAKPPDEPADHDERHECQEDRRIDERLAILFEG